AGEGAPSRDLVHRAEAADAHLGRGIEDADLVAGRRYRLAAHMFLRYRPPTSKSARVIWPSEQTRTASISTSNTFASRITASRRRSSIAGASEAWRCWKSRRRASCD